MQLRKKDTVINNKKTFWIKSVKITAAAVLSIFIAGELGLKYSATAGIITILSIQNTKRETFLSAFNRGLAYVCALFLAACAFALLGFTLPAFGVYLLLFALLCQMRGWTEAITMASVLITHFLGEKSMSLGMLWNETAVFAIGTGIGILVNLHLHPREKEFDRLAEAVDQQMRGVLRSLADLLSHEKESDRERAEELTGTFDRLAEALKQAELCAVANYNNALMHSDPLQLDYVHMREKQSVVLHGIFDNVKELPYLPAQASQVARLIYEIEEDYHRSNNVEGLLASTQQLFETMKTEELPRTREEFEARALLFYILTQINKLLQLKREFIISVQPEKIIR